jgi:hypothetical protein
MQTRRLQAVQCFVGLFAAVQFVGCSVIGHFVGSAIDGPSYTQVSLSDVDTLAANTPVEVTMKDESSIEGKIDGVERHCPCSV